MRGTTLAAAGRPLPALDALEPIRVDPSDHDRLFVRCWGFTSAFAGSELGTRLRIAAFNLSAAATCAAFRRSYLECEEIHRADPPQRPPDVIGRRPRAHELG